MGPVLEEYGVRFVALSRDTAEEARRHREADGLEGVTLLADPELEAVRTMGLEHHKALTVSSPLFRVFGLPIGIPWGFETMAIPTTVLMDEAGIVRFIDQAEDYRLRSDGARVEAALAAAYGEGRASPPS